jgi:hypothetical protein
MDVLSLRALYYALRILQYFFSIILIKANIWEHILLLSSRQTMHVAGELPQCIQRLWLFRCIGHWKSNQCSASMCYTSNCSFTKKGFMKLDYKLESLFGIASGYRLDEWGVGVRVPVGARILFSTLFNPALGLTHHSIQRVVGGLSPVLKQPGSEVKWGLGEIRILESKISSIAPRESNLRFSVLARTSNNC